MAHAEAEGHLEIGYWKLVIGNSVLKGAAVGGTSILDIFFFKGPRLGKNNNQSSAK